MPSRPPPFTLVGLMVCCLFSSLGAAGQTSNGQTSHDVGNYVVGPHDLLRITVWNQADVSGEYKVDEDGTFTFPLIGRVATRGLTLLGLETELTRLLANGFYRKPQVKVAVVEYRSKRIFVVGELRRPGTYPLTRDMSLIEALASAGSTTPDSADHVLILRSASARAPGPVLPGEDQSAEVIRVDLRTLSRGGSQNVVVRDGDTVFVPRALTVFVFGHVRNPGSYPIGQSSRVLQALSLAGGVTEYGAANRLKVVRLINGQEQEIKVKLNDPLQAGDTVVVPERFF